MQQDQNRKVLRLSMKASKEYCLALDLCGERHLNEGSQLLALLHKTISKIINSFRN